jgi:predicted chitinase
MKIDREKFFRRYRLEFGKIGSQNKVKRIEFLLRQLESDNAINKHIFDMSYLMATIHHEVGGTYKPIREWGRGRGKRYGIPDKKTGEVYYGRGFVQLTWASNYKKMSVELKRYKYSVYSREITHFLYYFPDKVLQPKCAYDIISLGLRRGYFTGRTLAHYRSTNDYVNARRIVNGTDKAKLIATYARRFHRCFKFSIIIPEAKVTKLSKEMDKNVYEHKEKWYIKLLRFIKKLLGAMK